MFMTSYAEGGPTGAPQILAHISKEARFSTRQAFPALWECLFRRPLFPIRAIFRQACYAYAFTNIYLYVYTYPCVHEYMCVFVGI